MKQIFTIAFSLLSYAALAQNASMDFEKYEPKSNLVVPEHKITRSKFPFIDVHNHQFGMPTQDVKALLKQMDNLNMRVMVNLSGRGSRSVNGQFGLQDPQYLVDAIANAKKTTPNRIIHFTNVSFIGVGEPGWAEKAVKELENDVKAVPMV
jgi:hypothetical protein